MGLMAVWLSVNVAILILPTSGGGHGGGGRRPGAYSSQSSQSTSLRSSSTGSASVETVGPDTTTSPGGGADGQLLYLDVCASWVTLQLIYSTSRFQWINMQIVSPGIPLLEENELLETATEGSNSSSVSGGDTGSATYSEASSKT